MPPRQMGLAASTDSLFLSSPLDAIVDAAAGALMSASGDYTMPPDGPRRVYLEYIEVGMVWTDRDISCLLARKFDKPASSYDFFLSLRCETPPENQKTSLTSRPNALTLARTPAARN